MGNYRDSEENICLKAKELLDNLKSHPGSEYQFAKGCLDVFREFFKTFGADSVLHPVFVQLYQNYIHVLDSYRGRIDFSKIERSFSSSLEYHKVSLDALASDNSPQPNCLDKTTKVVKDGNNPIPVPGDLAEYARILEAHKRYREKTDSTFVKRTNWKKKAQSFKEEALESQNEPNEVPLDKRINVRNAIKDEEDSYINESLSRVKGLYNVLSEIYEGCKLSDNGEFNKRFIETWLDFRKEVLFLKKHRDKADRIAGEIEEKIDNYEGSPQQLFEENGDQRIHSLLGLDGLLLGWGDNTPLEQES